jgi:micrococcal nuclease
VATSSHLIAVLILLVAGCDETPVAVPQRSSEAAEHTQLPVELLTTTTPPDATTEASEITGKVVHIIDGDTIDILTADKTKIRIRFNGIDAPETGQPFGRNAKQYLSEFIGGQTVRVVTHDKDRYGRTIGDVYLKDVPGSNFRPGTILPDWYVDRELVKRGLAWHYKKYSDDENLAMDEIRAKDLKLGLWSDARSIPPWDWRKLSKEERDKLR